MSKLSSSLSRRVASAFGPADALRSATLCRDAWHRLGLLVVYADDPDLTWDQRAFVNQIGERKFGRRNGAAAAAAPLDPEG